ncbi:MAG: TolB family protein [Candidatus Nanopelagicales bacterium]
MRPRLIVTTVGLSLVGALLVAPPVSAGTFDNNVQGSVNGPIGAVDQGVMGGAGTEPGAPGPIVCCSYDGNPPMWPEEMQWAPDGRTLALYQEKASDPSVLEVWIYDQVDNTLRNLHVLADGLSRPSFSPNSKQMALAQNGDIGVFDVGTGQLVRWVATGVAAQTHPSWSPDGNYIAYEAPDGVREVPATGGTSVLRIAGAARPYYAPNGREIAYTRDGKLWIANTSWPLNGERATNLSATDYVWSPDSQFFLGTFAEGTYEEGWTADLMQVTTDGQPVDGVWSTPTTWSWRPIPPPKAVMVKPTAAWATTTRIAASWRAFDEVSNVTTKDVRYRRISVVSNVSSGYTIWRTATTTSTGSVVAAPGSTYCFSTRARNEYEAVSRWSKEHCVSVPTDDRSLAATGPWLRGAASSYLASTYSSTTKQGATLISSSRAVSRVGVLALTCPSCGRVRVSIGGKVVGTISLASATSSRRLVFLPRLTNQLQGKVTLTVVSSGKLVKIDGLATSRS